MRSAREIEESITNLRDEVNAIIAVSEQEERDLTPEETSRVRDITDVQLPAENNHLITAAKVRDAMFATCHKRMNDEIEAKQAEANTEGNRAFRMRNFAIPKKSLVHSPITAFEGPDAERDAYIAGSVILAGCYNNESAKQFCRNHGLQVHGALSTNDNSKGGFLVPDEMQKALIRLREEAGVFSKYANKVPMGSDIIRIPRLLSDVTAYWPGEAVEITASDVGIGELELAARKIACMTKISSELDEDAVIDIGNMVTQSMAYAMALKLDQAGFNGDGTSTYGGVLGLKNAIDSAATSTAIAGNDAASNLDIGDFEAAVGMYPTYPGANPRWFMHKAFFYASAARLVDAAGGNTNITLASGASEQMFLGYPVTFTQVLLSTTTTSSSAVYGFFGDLRLGCSYGTRRSMRTEVTADRYFETDQIAIKVTERLAINVHERGADVRTRPIIMLKLAS